ncbi:hypothetical protein [Actinoplanes sp. CA-252034]|uniref:hypothetical protein n=1 Tax=Actinoplanes sp. CA-252034 TaxID=3239906 RepID=UPI003D969F5D
MFDGRAFTGDQRLIDEWRGAIEKRAAHTRELETRLAQLSETSRSPDGLVTVTAGPAGDLTALDLDLDLGEGIRHRAAAVTAREIVTTLRAAHVALVAAVAAVASEIGGADVSVVEGSADSDTSRPRGA